MGGGRGLVCFSTTITKENQLLHCVQPQLWNNVEPIFRNHYSEDEKQNLPATFFCLFKNTIILLFTFFLVSFLHFQISHTLFLLLCALPPGKGKHCSASLKQENTFIDWNINKDRKQGIGQRESILVPSPHPLPCLMNIEQYLLFFFSFNNFVQYWVSLKSQS